MGYELQGQGHNKPHRGDRQWVNGWSPEQIANRLKVDFPDDKSMRISHEAIYQALYIQGRGDPASFARTASQAARRLRSLVTGASKPMAVCMRTRL